MPKYCSTIYRTLKNFLFLFFQIQSVLQWSYFSYDAVFNIVKAEEFSVGFAMISFIGIDFFNGLFGVPAVDGAVWKIVGIVY